MNEMTRKNLLQLGMILFAAWVIGLYTVALNLADFRYPDPGTDEASFLYPAYSFSQTGSFFSENINPDRTVMWMPPGHAVVYGTLFTFTGLSLEAARTLSAVLVLGAFCFLFLLAARYGYVPAVLLVVGLFFLNRYTIVTANTARMEALVLFVALGGFALLQRNGRYVALAMLALAPLIHPNGMYFLAAGLLAHAVDIFRGRSPLAPARHEWLALGGAFLLWAAYAFHIASNWPGFLNDMGFQFSFKHDYYLENPIRLGETLLFPLLALPLALYAAWRRLAAGWLLVIAMPAWLIHTLGRLFWYEIYVITGYLLLSLVLVHVIYDLIERSPLRRAMLRWAAKTVVFAILLVLLYLRMMIEIPVAYPEPFVWNQMRLSWEIDYLSETDKGVIRDFLRQHRRKDGLLRVHYYPMAEGMMFQEEFAGELLFLHPIFCDVKPDLRIVRVSRFLPTWELDHTRHFLALGGIDPADPRFVFHARDNTEVWYFSRPETP
jgi:hypothetical protein